MCYYTVGAFYGRYLLGIDIFVKAQEVGKYYDILAWGSNDLLGWYTTTPGNPAKPGGHYDLFHGSIQ